MSKETTGLFFSPVAWPLAWQTAHALGTFAVRIGCKCTELLRTSTNSQLFSIQSLRKLYVCALSVGLCPEAFRSQARHTMLGDYRIRVFRLETRFDKSHFLRSSLIGPARPTDRQPLCPISLSYHRTTGYVCTRCATKFQKTQETICFLHHLKSTLFVKTHASSCFFDWV